MDRAAAAARRPRPASIGRRRKAAAPSTLLTGKRCNNNNDNNHLSIWPIPGGAQGLGPGGGPRQPELVGGSPARGRGFGGVGCEVRPTQTILPF